MTVTRIVGHGINDEVPTQVDGMHRALRASLRPPELGVFGSYRLALNTGAMAAGLAAASPIFEIRWVSNTPIMLLRRVTLMAYVAGTGFTAGQVLFNLFRATNFTALDSTGGATVTFKGKDNVKASRLQASQLQSAGGIALANTGALSGGTKTLDDNPFASYSMQIGTGTQLKLIDESTPLYDARSESNQPEEFWNNEGFVIAATVPATGVWGPAAITVEWDEIDPARYFGNYH